MKLPSSSASSSSSNRSASTNKTQSSEKSKSSVRGPTVSKLVSSTVPLPKSTLRRGSSDEKNKYTRAVPAPTSKASKPKRKMTEINEAVSARDYLGGKTARTLPGFSRRGNQSTFEKVDTHDGHTTYLGSGNISDLENCIRDCLSRSRCRSATSHHAPSHEYRHRSLNRASVLEDYSYDGILEPKHHGSHSNHSDYYDRYCRSAEPHHDSHHHHHQHASAHHSSPHHSHRVHHKRADELSLGEIREVNDTLAKYGIPVFSHHPNPHMPHHQQHSVGEILSACQLLMNDPRIASLQRDGSHAVQHVWDQIHNHAGVQNPTPGYASPAVQAVSSRLFHPNQTPYDPVHGVASHLFSQPQYPPPQYPPPQPPPPGPNSSGQSVLSRLFGGGQSSPPPPPPPPPAPYNPGQSAIARLFGGPQNPPPSQFANNFNQYPGNNQHVY